MSVSTLPARARTLRAPTALALVALVAMLALGLGGCGGESATEPPPPPPTVSGAWSGTSQGVTLNLTLVEGAGGAVSGSGNIVGTDANMALTVRQGSHAYPDLSLVLGATGYQDMNFAARLGSATQMTGTLNGSGFDNFNLNLNKR